MKNKFLFYLLAFLLVFFLFTNCKNDKLDDASQVAFLSILQRLSDSLLPTYITSPSTTATTITLTIAVESTSRIQLMWTSLPTAVNYKVYRDISASFTPSSTNEVVSTSTSITLTNVRNLALVTPLSSTTTSAKNSAGLTAGIRYYYKIAGVAANGTETYSNEASAIPASGFTVNTHAGSGVIGNTNGDGFDAKFNFPQGLSVDSTNGFIYLADSGNQVIRRISPRVGAVVTSGGVAYAVEGQATTFAGTGSWGNADSSVPSTASFFDPWSTCIIGTTIYVADSTNHSIRAITTAGVVSTLAGLNTAASGSGNVNNTGTAARFNYPQAITCDTANNIIYVADTYNNAIRAVTTGGVVTTLAGTAGGSSGQSGQGSANGTGTAATFYLPRGIVIDNTQTNLYVADSGNHMIRQVVRATGVVTTFAGSAGVPGKADGTGTAATFYNPRGLAFSSVSTSVYVADTNNHLIRNITTAGVVTTVAGTGVQGSQDGVGIYASFWYPQGIAFTGPAAGTGCTPSATVSNLCCSSLTPCLFVSDTENHKIRRIIGSSL